MKVLKDLNVIKSYLIMLKENMFKPKKQFRSEDDDDE